MTTYNKLYYSISETAKLFNEEVSAIRYWEKEFTLLKPKKNKRGVRFFTAEDMENLKIIHYLVRIKKLTIEGAKQELKFRAEATAQKVEILSKLERIKNMLENIKNTI